MGPGSRRELLEDLMGDRNWKKTVALGNTLLRRMKEAIPQCSTHVENHRELEAHMDLAIILQWRTVVEAWEADRSQPNPYMAETTTLSQDAIRLRLTDAEATALAAGTLHQLHDEVTPSMYVATGLDLEYQQYKLLESLSSLGLHATDRQRLTLINCANSLCMKISNFYDVQKLYCPGAFMIVSRANDNNSPPNATEEVGRLKLCLPSSIKTQLGCTPELQWWEGKVHDNNGTHDIMVEGVNVYALRQADIRIRLAASFASKWACVPDYLKLYNPLDPHEMPQTASTDLSNPEAP
ncbi:hypothetical protein EYR40_010466 [Pleurotus pulmonarius]|nr:hypothetical protein EYR40_010466 [Pleurotus pulmonarius]